MASNGMARGHVRGGRAPQFLTFGLLIVICVLAFNYWNVSSKSKILQKQVQEMTSTLEELAMKKIHLEKRSEALQIQITESNRKTVDLRGEKDKCDLDLGKIQMIEKDLTLSLSGCEDRRIFVEKSLEFEMENSTATLQLLNECTRKLSIAVEEEDLINDKQRAEVQQQNQEINQLTDTKEELAGNLQKCQEEKDEVMNLARNFKTQAATAQRDVLQCKEASLQCQNQLQQLVQQQQAAQQQPGMQQQQYQQKQLPVNQGIGNQQYGPVDQQQQYVQQPNDLQQQQQQPNDLQQQQQANDLQQQQYIQQQKQSLEQQLLLQQQQLEQAQQMHQREPVGTQQNGHERGVPLEVGDKVVEQGQQDPGLPEREANEVNQEKEAEGEVKDETIHQEENNAREEEEGGPAYRDDQGEVDEEAKAHEEREAEARRLEIEEQRLADGREEENQQDGGEDGQDGEGDEGGDREDQDGGEADQQEGPGEYGDDERDTEEQAAEGANVPVVDQDTDVEDNEHGNENNRDNYPDHEDINNDKDKENQEGEKDAAQGHYADGDDPPENHDEEDEHAKDVYGGEDDVEDANQDHV